MADSLSNQYQTFIHVGLPKTGSTLLQTKVFPHLEHTFYLSRPYTQENHAFNQLQYADNSIYNQQLMQDQVRLINNAIGSRQTLLISDELFFGQPSYRFFNRSTIAERLAKLWPEAQIIIFLRNQKDFIVSLYLQLVKEGRFLDSLGTAFLHQPGRGYELNRWINTPDPWDPAQSHASWYVGNGYINYMSICSPYHFKYSCLLAMYQRLFPKVHVFLYEDLCHDPADTLERLASVLSKPLPPGLNIGVLPRVNTTQEKAKIQARRNSYLFNRFSRGVKSRIKLMLLTKLISSTAPILDDESMKYVESVLKQEALYDDNQSVNDELRLGMEKYADKYFHPA
jgi:hypothetical protein